MMCPYCTRVVAHVCNEVRFDECMWNLFLATLIFCDWCEWFCVWDIVILSCQNWWWGLLCLCIFISFNFFRVTVEFVLRWLWLLPGLLAWEICAQPSYVLAWQLLAWCFSAFVSHVSLSNCLPALIVLLRLPRLLGNFSLKRWFLAFLRADAGVWGPWTLLLI